MRWKVRLLHICTSEIKLMLTLLVLISERITNLLQQVP